MTTLTSFPVPLASTPASPNQELVNLEKRTASALLIAPTPHVTDRSSKGKTPAQDTGISSEELKSFSPEHDNLVMSVSNPAYTRKLTALINAWKERKLLEGIGNNLILSAGRVFQQLEGVQLLEDELKDA